MRSKSHQPPAAHHALAISAGQSSLVYVSLCRCVSCALCENQSHILVAALCLRLAVSISRGRCAAVASGCGWGWGCVMPAGLFKVLSHGGSTCIPSRGSAYAAYIAQRALQHGRLFPPKAFRMPQQKQVGVPAALRDGILAPPWGLRSRKWDHMHNGR
jgi:hypothetical protein